MKLFRVAVLSLAVMFIGSAAAAVDGASFIGSSDYAAKEPTFSGDAARHLSTVRGSSATKSARVVSVRVAALDSGVITIVTPDGQQMKFMGSKIVSDRSVAWVGRSTSGTFSVAVAKDGGVAGFIRERGGRTFQLTTLDSHFQLFAEVVVEPFTETTRPAEPDPERVVPQPR